jgi:hypothetical protein
MEETEKLYLKQGRLRPIWLSGAVSALGCYRLHQVITDSHAEVSTITS